MFVRDVMTRNPQTVTGDCGVKRAVTILAERGISSMPVVDDEGRICGVVSEADLIREAFPPDPRSHVLPPRDLDRARPVWVEQVMSTHALTVHETTDVVDAVDVMTSTAVKSLPVVDDDDRVVGVVSRSDLVKVSARGDQDLEREVDSLLITLGHPDWAVEARDGVVTIDGPATGADRSLAEVAARTVAGVVAVEVL